MSRSFWKQPLRYTNSWEPFRARILLTHRQGDNRQLMMAVLHDKVNVAKTVNVTVLPLEDAPRGCHDFHKGAAKKFVLDPHGMVRSRRAGAELATGGYKTS
jgi:hypothetical protein